MLLIIVELTLETSAERGSGDQCRGDDGKLLIRRSDARQPRSLLENGMEVGRKNVFFFFFFFYTVLPDDR